MRYYLDHQRNRFTLVPIYVDVKTGMLVQRFDGPREGEVPLAGGQDNGKDARQRDEV